MNVTCPLCGKSLELDISRWYNIPSAPLVYEGIIICDCATGEGGPLLVVRGGTEEEAEALARERWEAMPHSRLRTEVEALDACVKALDEAYMWRDMQVKSFAGCLNTGEFLPFVDMMKANKMQHDAALERVQFARARLAEIRGEK